MNKIVKNLILKALHLTGGRPLNTKFSGIGAIFTLHRVINHQQSLFNGILEITDKRLEEIIKYLIKNNYIFISLDQLYQILTSEQKIKQKFIILTFDDGYFDNYQLAAPILQRYEIPFAIYLTTDFADKKQIIWWYALEKILIENTFLTFNYQDQLFQYKCNTPTEKSEAFEKIRTWILNDSAEKRQQKINRLFENYLTSLNDYSAEFCLSWQQVIELASNELITIAAHTVSHQPLSKIGYEEALLEISRSKKIIENNINKKVEHFAYPFGSRNEFAEREIDIVNKLEFKTAVTTIPGNIFADNKNNLLALPRIFISEKINNFALNIRLNGIYQQTIK